MSPLRGTARAPKAASRMPRTARDLRSRCAAARPASTSSPGIRISRPSSTCSSRTRVAIRQQQPLTLANWIPDLFMHRVESNAEWSLFDPADVPLLPDLFGEDFNQAYEQAEARGLARKTVRARDLYAQMIRTIVDSGHGWMEFKDNANRASQPDGDPGQHDPRVEPLHRDPRGHEPGRNGGLQSRRDQSRQPRDGGRLRFRQARA